MKIKTSTVVFTLALAALVLAGCAAGINHQIGTENADGVIAGFWRGLWHGMIAPITLIISLFKSNVQMYEVHNSGAGYDIGFLIGVLIVYGGGHASRRARRRNDKIL